MPRFHKGSCSSFEFVGLSGFLSVDAHDLIPASVAVPTLIANDNMTTETKDMYQHVYHLPNGAFWLFMLLAVTGEAASRLTDSWKVEMNLDPSLPSIEYLGRSTPGFCHAILLKGSNRTTDDRQIFPQLCWTSCIVRYASAGQLGF